jgi:hypothetical protein
VEDESRPTLLWLGLAIVLGLAVVATAEWLGASAKCRVDTAWAVDPSAAQQSGYCEATHLPGMPDTIASALLAVGIFAMPVVIGIIGVASSLITRQRATLYWAGAVALVWSVAAAISVGFAGVTYPGNG